jgi:hypothetical protein
MKIEKPSSRKVAMVTAITIRALLISITLTLIVTGAIGNPISIRPGWELSGEDVTVNVFRSESRITGDYTFRAVQHPYQRSERTDYGVYITFPIILLRQQVDLEKPVGRIEGYDFALTPGPFDQALFEALIFSSGPSAGTWSTAARGSRPELPEGWGLVFFSGGFQRAATPSKDEVKVHISYTQPHLPGNISSYLPILPNNIVKANYVITFQARDGTSFSPVGSYDLVGQSSATNISFRPMNLQLMKVQVFFPHDEPAKSKRANDKQKENS